MKKLIPKFYLLPIFLFVFNAFAQGPGSLFVNAGPDQTIDCLSGGCVDLTATFLETFETASEIYVVTSIPFNPPFPFNGLANQLNPNFDDRWSVVENLPFDFCFFGNLEQQFQVGSNGVLRFEVDPGDITNGWQFTENLPNSTNPTLSEANVFTPVHDIDPSASTTEEIGYEVLGTFPNRVLVVSYFQVPLFSGACNSLLATHMAVFYEFSNVIEIYMQTKPVCPSWNGGNAALGIQNNAGTIAYVPPGRNTSNSPWTANNEAWQFSPIGAPTFDFVWLDDGGNIIGTTPTINVCAPGIYTAQVTYTNICNGDVVVLTDDVVVTTSAPFTIDLGPDIVTCDAFILLDAGVTSPPGTVYQWFYNGIAQGPPSPLNPTFNALSPNSGVYMVEAFDPLDPTCIVTDDIVIDFLYQPFIANPPIDLFICDDGVNPGIFNLTVNTPIILGGQDPANVNVTYHNSQSDADLGINPIITPDAYLITGNSEQIFIRIEDLTGTCFTTASFNILFTSVTSSPIVPNPYNVCDQDNSGDEILNLQALFTIMVLDGQNPLEYNVTYHLSQADADAGTNALPNPYTFNTSPLTIYVRIENIAYPSCFDTDQNFELILDFPPLINPTPSPLIVCDIDSNGFSEFTLSDADFDITLGDPDLLVTYHGTELDAINGVNELPTPYFNDDPYYDVVWARVESSVSSCYSVVALQLEVRNTPDVVTPSPLRLCDVNNPGDGVEVFDLTQSEVELLNGLDPLHYDIYYYVLEANAIAAGESVLQSPPGDFSLSIATPGAYQNQLPDTQTIYVLVVGNDQSINPGTVPPSTGESCYAIVELVLIVDPLPLVVLPLLYELCDDQESGSTTDEQSIFDLTTRNAEVSGGVLDVSVSWYLTPADEQADNAIVTPESFLNTTTPQTVIARVTDQRGCKNTTTLTLVVLPNPTPLLTPAALTTCDNGEDLGIGEFMLTDRDVSIINGEPGVLVSYHESIEDAELGLNALLSPYTNVVPFLQTVYARVTREVIPPSLSPACYTIVLLDLVVIALPDVPVSGFGDLFSCDTEGGALAEFNLEENTPFVLGIQDPGDFIGPTYHTSLSDAELGIGAIVNTTNYLSSGGETIWVRLESLLTGCIRISSFNLIVGQYPEILTPSAIEACDDEESGSNSDGVTIFDLTQYDVLITGGNPNYEVFYYESELDQSNGDAILTPESYGNISNPQTLYVSVFSLSEGCEAQTTLTLVVLPLPAAIDVVYELCDDNNDGFGLFDLSSRTAEIANGDTDVVISYHETLQDAENGLFSIDPDVLYENLTINTQTLWVRVERESVGESPVCHKIVTLELVVLPGVVLPLSLDPIVLCGQGNTAVFNLTLQSAAIYGSQSPDEFTLTFHESEVSAQLGTGAILNPESYTNLSNPQTIWVRLSSDLNGCYGVLSFEIEVTPGPEVTIPLPLDLCDDLGEPYDGLTLFDLTQKSAEITGGAAGVEVRYYETEEEAQLDQNRIDPDTSYAGENLQRIYARVIDGNTGCVGFTDFILRVYSNPLVGGPVVLALCDENDSGDGIEEFDLVLAEPSILNGGVWEVLYYESYEEALLGDPDLALGPLGAGSVLYSNTIPFEQIIYVRVTNQNQLLRCFEIVELTLLVNPLPDDSAVLSDLIVCELDTDGVGSFNLEEKVPEILNGQDGLVYAVSFYRSESEALLGINPIVNTTTFVNTSNPQSIYTGIINGDTGCYIGGVQFFNLIVQEGAQATAPSEPLVVCENTDEQGVGTGEGTFDLTQLNEEILTGQDPSEYVLTYHESLEDAQEGINAIVNVSNYISATRTLWARVSYTDPNPDLPSGREDCYALVEVSLIVLPAPIFVELPAEYRLCVDEFGHAISEEFGASSPPVIDTGLSTPEYMFLWYIDGVLQGDSEGSIVALSGGVYTVTIIDVLTGCESTASTRVVLSSPPTQYSAQVSAAFSGTHTITVEATGLGSYIYQLDDGPYQESPLFENVSAGTHYITITDANGCGSVVLEVNVIDYPLFFTPNADGYHDTWNIIGISGMPTAKIYIFDRYGKLLKQLSPLGEGWDGTYNGRPLPSSDYWFRVEYEEENKKKEFKGHFTLKR